MIEDLLFIAKNLLKILNSSEGFTENEKEYIVNVIRKIIFVVIIELKKRELYKNDILQNII